MDLFQDLVDVGGVRFRAFLALLARSGGFLGGLGRLLGWCLRHG